MADSIRIAGARERNLKGITLAILKKKLVIVIEHNFDVIDMGIEDAVCCHMTE